MRHMSVTVGTRNIQMCSTDVIGVARRFIQEAKDYENSNNDSLIAGHIYQLGNAFPIDSYLPNNGGWIGATVNVPSAIAERVYAMTRIRDILTRINPAFPLGAGMLAELRSLAGA